mgnify:CR=1 FL=1
MKNKVNNIRPFHIAIPVSDLERSRVFYQDILDCSIGRRDNNWIDFNFFSHQLVIHQTNVVKRKIEKFVDGKNIPIPHFGVILDWSDWEKLADKITNKIDFIVKPYIRFQGQIGEQGTMFFFDPDYNALEFKSFKDDRQIFEK